MSTPELPELELLRRELERDVVGKKVKTAELLNTSVGKRGGNKKAFSTALDGAKITASERNGMWLNLVMDNDNSILINLGEGSYLFRCANKVEVEKTTAVVITFTQHGQLRLIDPAKNGEMFVMATEEVPEFVGETGLDLVGEPVSWTNFGERLLKRKGKLKALLMDESLLVGIGPIYSDEILFEAGLRFDRSPDSLSTQEIRRLYRASVEILHDSIKHGGVSLGDTPFLDLAGEPGGYTSMLSVYARDGEMSPRARGPIVKHRLGSGYTYYCEQTQV